MPRMHFSMPPSGSARHGMSVLDTPIRRRSPPVTRGGRRPRSSSHAPWSRPADCRGRATAGLAEVEVGELPLDKAQTEVLLRLLGIALAARVAGSRWVPLVASAYGIRLTLTPAPGRFCTVATADGALHLDGFALSVTAAEHTTARWRELVPA